MGRYKSRSNSLIAASLILFLVATPTLSEQSKTENDFDKASAELDCKFGKIPTDAANLQTSNMQWSTKIPIDDDALTASIRKKGCDAAQRDKKSALAIKTRAQAATDCNKQMIATTEELDLFLSQAQMQIERFCQR